MCGIFCEVTCKLPGDNISTFPCEALNHFADLLKSRGPNCFSEHVYVGENFTVTFAVSVLWMQGPSLSTQPVTDSKGNVLLWNGDNFNNAVRSISDTMELFQALSIADNSLEVLAKICGPFSFVYQSKEKLYFGRDCLGRHSLLWGTDENKTRLVLTSVARRGLLGCTEVPAAGVFVLNLGTKGIKDIVLHPWSHLPEDIAETVQQNSEINFEVSSATVPSPISPAVEMVQELPLWTSILNREVLIQCGSERHNQFIMELLNQPEVKKNVLMLIAALRKAVEVRVKTQPGLCQECLSIDISSEKSAERFSLCNQKVLHRETESADVNLNKDVQESACEIKPIYEIVNIFSVSPRRDIQTLQNSSTKNSINMATNSDITQYWTCNHATIGILFSGGLDSAVLAVLAHEFVPAGQPIDLLNVAFERTRAGQEVPICRKDRRKTLQGREQENFEFQVPDRITGLKTLEELCRLFPERQWNFIEINVTKTELERERKCIISDLIYPLSTVLDDSLGCAVWFAARGRGQLKGAGEYRSTARVLLLGMGADELLGGYARHRTAFRHQSWSGLQRELAMDLAHISQRNLGRDDRVLSHHARQGRFPFLDEEVVSLITSLQPWERCWPSNTLPVGVGDKLLLRLAAWNLGLRNAANLPKRAFQFGSRIANPKEKATDKSHHLQDTA